MEVLVFVMEASGGKNDMEAGFALGSKAKRIRKKQLTGARGNWSAL